MHALGYCSSINGINYPDTHGRTSNHYAVWKSLTQSTFDGIIVCIWSSKTGTTNLWRKNRQPNGSPRGEWGSNWLGWTWGSSLGWRKYSKSWQSFGFCRCVRIYQNKSKSTLIICTCCCSSLKTSPVNKVNSSEGYSCSDVYGWVSASYLGTHQKSNRTGWLIGQTGGQMARYRIKQEE